MVMIFECLKLVEMKMAHEEVQMLLGELRTFHQLVFFWLLSY